jgi:hypothetical protein
MTHPVSLRSTPLPVPDYIGDKEGLGKGQQKIHCLQPWVALSIDQAIQKFSNLDFFKVL